MTMMGCTSDAELRLILSRPKTAARLCTTFFGQPSIKPTQGIQLAYHMQYFVTRCAWSGRWQASWARKGDHSVIDNPHLTWVGVDLAKQKLDKPLKFIDLEASR